MEIRTAGTKGVGVSATRKFKKNEIVLEEEPIIYREKNHSM